MGEFLEHKPNCCESVKKLVSTCRVCDLGLERRDGGASPMTRMFLNVPSSGGLRTRHSFLKVKNLSIEGQRCVPAWERALSSQAVSHHAQPTAGFVSRPRMIWSIRYPCVRPRAALPPSVLPKSTANPRGVVIRLVETHREMLNFTKGVQKHRTRT